MSEKHLLCVTNRTRGSYPVNKGRSPRSMEVMNQTRSFLKEKIEKREREDTEALIKECQEAALASTGKNLSELKPGDKVTFRGYTFDPFEPFGFEDLED